MKKIISLVLVFSMILSMICTSTIIVSANEKEVVNGSAGKIDVDNSNNKFAYDKTATPLYKNDYTDVTLTVGGDETELDSDVVLILGHRPSENIEYMTQLLNKLNTAVDGTKAKIKLGIVGFSHTTDDEIVLPLTEMKDTVPGNKMADYRFDDRYNDGKQYTESEEDFNKRREEYEAKLLEWEKDELLVTDMEYIIAIALEECERVYGGINLESSLITARDMLMADTDVAPERKHLIAISTGLTYFFDADNGNAATVPVSHNGYLFYNDRTWRYFRNANNNTYPVPVWYNDENGKDDWGKYWQDVLKWIEADQNDYVYTLSQPYNVFAANNNRPAGTYNPKNGRYTYYYAGNSILNPGADDIPGNKIINLSSAAIDPTVAGSASAHAFGYERAQYEAYVVFQQMSTKVGEKFTSILKDENGNYIQYDGLGYNCYSVYNPLNYYSTNGYDDTQAANPITSWKTGDQYIGHSFMNYLAGGEAPTFSFSSLDWITPIENKVLYSLSEGSKVVDKIGYDEKEGNFDFVDEIDGIQKYPVLTYLGKTYHTTKLETAVEGATYSYTFSEKEGAAPTFRMNYYVGDGKEGEYFEWIFDTNIVKYSNITLTYSLKLTDRSDEDGKHKVNTNQEAKLYPVDSDGKEGSPELFPIPYVEYIVIPEDPTGPNDYNKSKTATPLYDNRYTDVTLSVPGEVEENITDIMFVIDKSSSDVLSGDFANGLFSQLIEVQKATGAAIKVGVVLFNYTSHLWLPLTPLTEDNYQTLMAGLPKLSGGTNADAGLTLAKELLDADTEVDASRKHVIFISDGLSWVFEKEGTQYTVLAKDQSNGNWYNKYGVGTQPYLSIRTINDSWGIPNGFNSWDAFWTNIKTLVENDRNAGDKYLFEMTNHKGEDPTKPKPSELVNTEAGLAVSVPYSEKDNHAMNVERALYESWESYVALQEAGYNCNAYFTGDNGTIGQHFMKMLAGTSSMDFEDIKHDILYSVSKGSKVIDYIGYDPDVDYGYDFDFIDEINGEAKLPVLMVGEKTYHTTKLDAPVGDATASYVFSAKIDGEPTFSMDYFRGNGTTTEHFVWTINEDISRFAPVSLTYTLDLVDRSEIPGTYGDVDTNQKAILYPVDSDGNDGTPEPFEKPKVEYEVDPVSIVVEKIWDDANDQDGVRPERITIRLYDDQDKEVASKTITANDGWTCEFTGLREYRDGKKINYRITEDTVDGYTTKIEDFVVTNSYTPETIVLEGEKLWDDANDQDGLRPDSIIVNLIADGDVIDSVEVTEDQNGTWNFVFENLPKYRDGGIEIVYEVSEEAVEGYIPSINGTIITNVHTPETVAVEGTKTWDDANDQDGLRPERITINLLANGKVVETITVTEADGWSWKFENLAKFENGVEIKYSITEEKVEGYETVVDGYNVTNTHTPATVVVEGEKIWDDNDDQDGIRPESITINLLANGKVIETLTVTEADGWSWKFENLAKFENGVEIKYSITEEKVEGYETTIDGFNVINTHKPEETEVTGQKFWNDNNDQDGLRPDEITINLLADGEVIDSVEVKEVNGKWIFEFTNLPKYKDHGVEIVYTVEEVAVEGYETTINGTIVTNKHNPETIVIAGEKFWNDADDQDGIRPQNVTLNLLADGVIIRTFIVTEADGWKYELKDLPKYKDGGKEIVYTITEKAVEGYESVVDGFNVTNTHIPEEITVEGEKIWNDANNQDGKRPGSITINLLADNVVVKTVTVEADNWSWTFENLPKYRDGGIEIVYSISEVKVDGYTTEYEGFNVINTYNPEKTNVEVLKVWDDADNQDGIRPESITINLLKNGKEFKTATLTAADGWAYNFTDLDKYEAGKKIVYSISEVKVEGYETVIEGYTITNTHTPATVVVEGNKTWNDADDQDGIRPESITINLLANGTVVDTITVTEADGWKWSFTGLAKFENGVEIKYSITEEKVEGYEATVDGYNVTNTHTPATVVVEGNKTWNDADDQDGIRPESITINLLANGEVIKTITVTEAAGWKWSFTDLAKFENGVEIKYSITEEKVEGYETLVEGYNVTNTHTPATVVVEGEKIWDDNDDQDGLRPDEITINLLANGEVVETIKVTKDDNWKFIFENLAKFEAGVEITYTIEEVAVEGYAASYNGYIVTNTHAPETTSVKVDKIWDDEEDADGVRPESITVHLYADGVKVDTKVITEADGWTCMFENLAKYNAGVEIVYTVSEDEVEEYESSIEGNAAEGFVITNTHELTEIPEESVPLAPPATGDKSITALLIMSITSVLLGALVVSKRRREI